MSSLLRLKAGRNATALAVLAAATMTACSHSVPLPKAAIDDVAIRADVLAASQAAAANDPAAARTALARLSSDLALAEDTGQLSSAKAAKIRTDAAAVLTDLGPAAPAPISAAPTPTPSTAEPKPASTSASSPTPPKPPAKKSHEHGNGNGNGNGDS